MLCTTCGHANPEGSAFCAQCGTALGAPTTATATAPATSRPEAQVDTEAWEAIVGPRNRAYYLQQFAFPPGATQVRAWHWPAVFVTWFWLFYRKLYGWAVVYFVAPYLLAFVLALAFDAIGANGYAAAFLNVAYLAALLVVPPMVANRLYYRHCRAIMDRAAKRPGMSRERYLGILESKGGTSSWVLVVVVLFVLVFLMGIVAAIAIPAYHDYTMRAKVAEAIRNVAPITKQVGARYERTGIFPSSLQDLDALPEPSPQVRSIVLDPSSGIVRLVTTVEQRGEFVEVEFVPDTSGANRRVRWTCRPVVGAPKIFPLSCRGTSSL